MRRIFIAACALVGVAFVGPSAHAIGCFSGAVAGAVAGHMAGHGVLGAVGGCIAGHEYHKHKLSHQAYQNRDDYVRQRQQVDPSFKDPWTRQ